MGESIDSPTAFFFAILTHTRSRGTLEIRNFTFDMAAEFQLPSGLCVPVGIAMDNGTDLPDLKRANLGEEVHRVLRDRIFSREFASGERLDLPSIERRLGVSRTPLKLALERLASEGLVEIVPRRGTYVTTPTRSAIDDTFSVRGVLEAYAITRCAELITDAQLERMEQLIEEMRRIMMAEDQAPRGFGALDHSFHALIVEAAANDTLTRLWSQVDAHVQGARIRHGRGSGRLDLATEDHAKILAALRMHDSNTAETLLREHIGQAAAMLQSDLQTLDGS